MERGTANFLRVLSLLVLVAVAAAQVTLPPGKVPVNSKDPVKYGDCEELWKAGYTVSGAYVLHMNKTSPFLIHCEFTKDNVYNVIQQRVNGSVNFTETMAMYIRGFGIADSDYWAGLDYINHLTMAMGNSVLTIHLADWSNNQRYANYSSFVVTSHSDGYKMFVSGFHGTVPDNFTSQNAIEFKTYDNPDVDGCAVHVKVGWWYSNCEYCLLNGHYYRGHYIPPGSYYDGIFWSGWKGYAYSLKAVSMSVSRT